MKSSKHVPVWVVLVLAASILFPHAYAAKANAETGAQTIPKEALEFYAKVIASVPASARQWIHEKAKYVAQTPGAENSVEFSNIVKDYARQFPNRDVMETMFVIFKESIEQSSEDKKYFLQKIGEMNKIAQAMSDYLKYLIDSTSRLVGKNDSDTLCEKGRQETRKGMKELQILQSRVPLGTPFKIDEPKTIGALKSAIRAATADLKARGASLKKLIETDSVRLQVARARYSELFPKMMDSMKKIPPAWATRKNTPIK
jgi:hypothetical protein